jgi:acid stress-induced BolA-like protein IbaG/YrbA
MNPQDVAALIRSGLPDAQILVESPDNTHFSARIVAREFTGLKRIARHQLIYRALGEPMGREIHALSIDALSPEEWAARTAS